MESAEDKKVYDLIFKVIELESDTRRIEARIEVAIKLDREINVEKDVFDLLICAMHLTEVILEMEKIPFSIEHLLLPSIGALLLAIPVGFFTSSLILTTSVSALGALFGSIFVKEFHDPSKNYFTKLRERLVITIKTLDLLYKRESINK